MYAGTPVLPVLTWAGLCFSNTLLRHASFIIPPSVRRLPCVGIVVPTKLRHDKLLSLEIPSCHGVAPSEDELSNMVVGRRPWEAKAVWWCCYCLKGITHAGQMRAHKHTHTHTQSSIKWMGSFCWNVVVCMHFILLSRCALTCRLGQMGNVSYLWSSVRVTYTQSTVNTHEFCSTWLKQSL